jgi:hypothetical protein
MLTFKMTIMKKILYSLVLIGSISVIAGCSKFLDKKPLAQVAVSQFYKTKYDVDAAVAGMYSAFQQQMIGESQYKERVLYWGDYRSDNFERFLSYTTTNTTEITLNGITTDNEFADWSGLYTVIGRTNSNIKYVPGAAATDNTVTQTVINKALAESYAMRAMCYFYIVRVWGDAVVWTEPYESVAQDPEKPRTAADKVITENIIPDLLQAYSLTVKAQTPVVWSLSEGAICAILADVYMWKKDYANAILWINNLYKAKSPTGSVYTGTTGAFLQPGATWKTIFTAPATSIESIWNIHWDYTKNACACMTTSYTANNKPIVVDPNLYNSWILPQTNTATATGDIRPKQTLDAYTVTDVTKNLRDRFIKWYQSPVNPTAGSTATDLTGYYNQTLPVYMPMYRLADIYLLHAEALNATNDLAGALKYLNFVHVRAGLPAYTAANPLVANKTAMTDAILLERQWELIGEGKRWFDLVRTDHVFSVMDPLLRQRQIAAGTAPADAKGFSDQRKILWPLTRGVLNANKKLVQNPGY